MSQEADYRPLAANFPDAFAYQQIIADDAGNPLDYIFLEINPAFELMVGLSRDEIIGKRVTEIYPKIYMPAFYWIGVYGRVAAGCGSIRFEQYFEPARRWYEVIAYSERPGFFATVFYDITGHIFSLRQAEEALHKSEEIGKALINAIPDMVFRCNREGVCLSAEIKDDYRLLPQGQQLYQNGDLTGQKINTIFPPDVAGQIMAAVEQAFATGKPELLEYSYPINKDKFYFEARLVAAACGEVVTIVRDNTERKRFEERLKHLSFHDQLTGLYNRAYFENELFRLEGSRDYPVSIISVDLDGIKLVNDTLGHARGDDLLRACAKLLRQSLRTSDILARVGGDEFVALLPRTTRTTGLEIVNRVHEQLALYNREQLSIPLSISIGIAVAENRNQLLRDVYKEADDLMYREKLQKGAAARAQIINAVVSSLKEKDYLNDGHGQRLKVLCRKLAEKAGLSELQQSRLDLLSYVHDLGKAGIQNEILFKQGPLTEEESKLIRQHSEKGYRIALSSANLSDVADLILKHHEWWNGGGYPLGLKREEIPVECRILAIADAYDTIVNRRHYRKAKSKEEALAELKRGAGRQFDPGLTEIFISLVEQDTGR